MKSRSLTNSFLHCSSVLLLVLGLNHATAVAAQTPSTRTVHSIFLESVHSAAGTSLERRVAQELKTSGSVTIANNKSAADGVLEISTVTWPEGLIATNPRGRTLSVASYQGYASAQLTDNSGQVLWSYLVTPRRFHVSGIEADLAQQLSRNLVSALRSGLAVGTLTPRATGAPASLRIAGATFPAPLYRKWFETFEQQQTGSHITYDAVGSAQGLNELAAGKIDIAASDIPPHEDSSSDPSLLRIPTVVGGVVPIFNLPGTTSELRLTGSVLADIYGGKIRKWNDSRIREWNKNVHLPDEEIQVVHRSDGSGTTFVWTSFLASSEAEWKNRVGDHTKWPLGIGAEGNQGVADQVSRTPNSIGYVELTYAIQHQLQYASVRNPAGNFVRADISTITAAVTRRSGQPSSQVMSALNAPGPEAYPIATFTWFLVPRNSLSAEKKSAVLALLQWVLTEGQKECSSLAYVPLPREIGDQELREINVLR